MLSDIGLSAGFGFIGDGDEFYFAKGKEIGIYRTADHSPRLRFRAAPDLAALDCSALSADGRLVAAASGSTGIGVWKISDGKPSGAVISLKERVRGLVFHPDQRHLLARLDNEVRIFDLKAGQEDAPSLRLLGLKSAAFSADGRLLLTTVQGQARLWDWHTARPVIDPLKVSFDAALSSDGQELLRDQYSICQVMPLPPETAAPQWLSELVECVYLQRLREDGISESVPTAAWFDLRKRLSALPPGDRWNELGRWFAADPWDQPLSPGGSISTKEFLQKQLPELQTIMQQAAGAAGGAAAK